MNFDLKKNLRFLLEKLIELDKVYFVLKIIVNKRHIDWKYKINIVLKKWGGKNNQRNITKLFPRTEKEHDISSGCKGSPNAHLV